MTIFSDLAEGSTVVGRWEWKILCKGVLSTANKLRSGDSVTDFHMNTLCGSQNHSVVWKHEKLYVMCFSGFWVDILPLSIKMKLP